MLSLQPAALGEVPKIAPRTNQNRGFEREREFSFLGRQREGERDREREKDRARRGV